MLQFKLEEFTNRARVQINIPGEEESSVVINGIKETPTNMIDRYFGFGTYSLKITNTNYIDYYGTFTVDSTNSLYLTPNMKQFKEPTLFDKVFKNYERNTKIFFGLTIASAIFSVGAYVYAGEILDSTMVDYYNKYQNVANKPQIDLRKYNTAMNVREEVKIMLGSKCMTITELAKRMSELSGKNYTQSLISHKLASESLKYTEMKLICKILGYRIYIDIDEIRLGK